MDKILITKISSSIFYFDLRDRANENSSIFYSG
jgi:hypothetical protein